MPKEKIQVTLPENVSKILREMSEKKGFSRGVIISMAINYFHEMEIEKEKAQIDK